MRGSHGIWAPSAAEANRGLMSPVRSELRVGLGLVRGVRAQRAASAMWTRGVTAGGDVVQRGDAALLKAFFPPEREME